MVDDDKSPLGTWLTSRRSHGIPSFFDRILTPSQTTTTKRAFSLMVSRMVADGLLVMTSFVFKMGDGTWVGDLAKDRTCSVIGILWLLRISSSRLV